MPSKPVRVLLIEDKPPDIFKFMGLLSSSENMIFEVQHCGTLQEGIDALSLHNTDIVLLSLSLDGVKGYDGLTTITSRVPHIPVVTLTLKSRESTGRKSIREGAQDYLVKTDIDVPLLERTLNHAIERQNMLTKIENKNRELMALAEMKSEFISMVSHEIRTPLTIMKEFISILADEIPGELNKEQKDYLKSVHRNIKRLTVIINDLLDISKLEDGKMKFFKSVTDVPFLVRNILSSFEAEAQKQNVSLKTDLPKKMPKIFVDPDRITQVLTNIIGNALKFTPEKGSITAAAGPRDKHVEISITDTGPGIDKKDLGKVFERYKQAGRTARSKKKGTGLGLAIARKIVEMHGGEIWVESPPRGLKKGSRFIFQLPLYNPIAVFRANIAEATEHSRNTGTVFSAGIISVVNFEQFVESAGHETSEHTLQHIYSIIRKVLRDTDKLVLNYDKGEFYMLLSECGTDVRNTIITRIEKNIGDYELTLAKEFKSVEFKLGISSYPDDGKSDEELINTAYKNLSDVRKHVKRILIVDDDKELDDLMKDMLVPKGHHITIIPDGAKAVEAVRKEKYDLVFLDLMMPEMNGADAFRAMKDIHPDIQVIIVTAYPNSDLLFKAMEYGPLTVISKPFSVKHFQEVTERLLY